MQYVPKLLEIGCTALTDLLTREDPVADLTTRVGIKKLRARKMLNTLKEAIACVWVDMFATTHPLPCSPVSPVLYAAHLCSAQ